MSGYDRLAPFIREFIFDSGWTSLRDVQEKAIDAILGGEGHVLIAAGTASGKTEAAFFPILTRMCERPGAGFGALYVGPLKALINDQFERLDALLDEADIPVYAWHGDRPESEKKRARRAPRGVLQITPEALEGLLMRHSAEAARMLSGLQFVVIDELHAFMGTDRGLQLQCQLNRIDRLIGHGARRVGLSATIADYAAARRWLSAGTQWDTQVVESAAGGRKLDLALQNYVAEERLRDRTPAEDGGTPSDPAAPGHLPQRGRLLARLFPKGSLSEEDSAASTVTEGVPLTEDPASPKGSLPEGAGAAQAVTEGVPPASPKGSLSEEDSAAQAATEGVSPEETQSEEPRSEGVQYEELPLSRLYPDLYALVRGRRCLVFTNSRAETEAVVAGLRSEAERRGEPDVFHAHHGSLSAAIRQDAEAAMKQEGGAAVAVATRTLELGIDIGKLDRVLQLGAADSCAGFVQRLGRSGRRGQSAVMRFLTREKGEAATAFDELPWELLRTVAVVQLYLEERWVEPFEEKPLPYSLLFQQIISALMPGEKTSRALAKAVHTLPAFQDIPAEDYMALLRHMLETDMVEQTETGTLLPGLKGERLAGDYRFLSVFKDSGGCRVVCGDREIGSIDGLPQVGQTFTMAGRTWQVTGVDGARGTVYVNGAAGGESASGWTGGGAQVHDRIVEKMRDVLAGDADYAWLHAGAKRALARARADAAEYEPDRLTTSLGPGKLLVHPWLGTRKLDTLAWLLRGKLSNRLAVQTVKSAGDRTALIVETLLPQKLFLGQLRKGLEELEAEALIPLAPATPLDRNDLYLPEALRRKAYVYNHLDVEGLKAALLARGDFEA